MRNIMLITALFCSTMLAAQQPQDDANRKPHQSEKMREALKLSDDQYMKISEIRSQYRQSFDEVRKTSREEFRSIREKRDAEIDAILTDEQREKWNSIKEERRHKKPHYRKDGARDLKGKLNLSDEQVEGMKKAGKEFREQMHKVRKDSTTSHEDRRKEFQRIGQNYNDQVKSLLTESQYEQWISAKKEMHNGGPKKMHKRRYHKGEVPGKGGKFNKEGKHKKDDKSDKGDKPGNSKK